MTNIKSFLLLVCTLLCVVDSIRSASIRTTSESNEASQKESSATTTTVNASGGVVGERSAVVITGSESRTENARSLDISKYTSTDFHNKLYDAEVSSYTEKAEKSSSFQEKNSDRIDLITTVVTPSFDETLKKLTNTDDKTIEKKDTIDDKSLNDKSLNDKSLNDKSINDKSLKDKSLNSPEHENRTSLDFVRYANVLQDIKSKDIKKNIEKILETEKGVNFESVYNDTEFADQKAINISKRGSTIKLNETTTLSPNLLPSIETTTEQAVIENNIYPVLVPLPQTTETNFRHEEKSTTQNFENLYEMTKTDPIDDSSTTTQAINNKETFYEMTNENIELSTTTISESYISSETIATTARNDESTTMNDVTTITWEPLLTSTQESNTQELNTQESNTETINTISPSIDIDTESPQVTMDGTDSESQMTTTIPTITSAWEETTMLVTQNVDYTTLLETTEATTLTNYIPKDATTSKVVTFNNDIRKETTNHPVTTVSSELDEDAEDLTDDDYIDLQNRKAKQNTESSSSFSSVTTITDDDTMSITTEKAILVISTVAPTIATSTAEPTLVTIVDEELGHTNNVGIIDPDQNNGGTVLAIILSSVGAVCLILLAILLFVMRRRQRRFNYGQRCTPVSLDSYSMDNVSVYNSVRRKNNMRSSKRSYGNPAFDDSSVSHPLNFQALVRFARNAEDMKAEFDEIPQVHAKLNELPEGCETKNRYANVIPLPETRVFLSVTHHQTNEEGDINTTDYINANYVTGPKGVRNYYIACQAPMQNTVNDFWRMVWEQQSKVILMLTHLFENGIEKCVDYLPPSEVLDCHRMFGDYQVTLKKREVKDKYIISSLQLKNMVSNSWREVTHMWYSGWPETGVPSEESSLIAFLIEARSFVKLVQNAENKQSTSSSAAPSDSNGGRFRGESSPVIVHCSPGTGRTGTVIACDIAIREFELKRIVDIPKIVCKIRRDRASSVQTKDQYQFIYKVITLYATKLTGGSLDSL